MRKIVDRIGYGLVALIMVGLCLTIALAWRKGQSFYGINYLGQPLGTYSTALVLALVGAIGLIRLVQRVAARGRRDKRPGSPLSRG